MFQLNVFEKSVIESERERHILSDGPRSYGFPHSLSLGGKIEITRFSLQLDLVNCILDFIIVRIEDHI